MAAHIPSGLPPILNHPLIGKVQGKYNKGVVQYLGIEYASLEDRFADPEVVKYSEVQNIDATRHGPPVVTPSGSAEMEMSFIQKAIPTYDIPEISDRHGLNLNITVPVEGGENLPVVVYIHGGGFVFGSSSYPHYDQSKVVELSAIMEQPIVAVNFNYRLGVAGFLTSKELRDHGYRPNRGFLDQRAALEWIKIYISGFGGDPQKITVAGQSAGAASITYMMHSEKKLFNQAILFGGSFLMMKPSSLQDAEELYRTITGYFGLGELTPAERVKALLTMPQDELVAQLTKEFTSLGPVLDGELIPSQPTIAGLKNQFAQSLPGSIRCQRLFTLESKDDGTIFQLVNLSAREEGISDAFRKHVEENLSKDAAAKFNDHYGLKSDTPDHTAIEIITRFISAIAFYVPSFKIAEAWPGSVAVGHFNERNPWDGQHKGMTNHLLDIAFVWGNYNQSYIRANWTVARALAENLVSFVSEKDDLPNFQQTSRVTVYGPSEENISSHQVPWDSNEVQREFEIFELGDAAGGIDKLLELAEQFLRL